MLQWHKNEKAAPTKCWRMLVMNVDLVFQNYTYHLPVLLFSSYHLYCLLLLLYSLYYLFQILLLLLYCNLHVIGLYISYTRKNFWNRSYFFLNILSIYICILIVLSNKIGILVYNYIYLIYLKKSLTDFRNFYLCMNYYLLLLLLLLILTQGKISEIRHTFF